LSVNRPFKHLVRKHFNPWLNKNNHILKINGKIKSASASVLLLNNARPHTATRTRALLENFNWELFDHTPYIPDHDPSDYHLFTYMKDWLGSQRFNNIEDLMEGVKTWLSSEAADFFHSGIQEPIPRYEKCLSSSGDYVER
jgi:hypothetical protein